MKPLIVCGIEIEMEFNRKHLSINKAGYHNNYNERSEYAWFGKHFIVESDSSLDVRKFENGDVCEMISVPFSVDKGMEVVDGFIKKFGEFKLSEVINFNDTTGAHIHLSVLNADKEGSTLINLRPGIRVNFKGKPVFFRDVVGANILNEIKSKVCERVKEELPASVYEKWSSALTRSNYAAPIIPNQLYAERGREWNLTLKNRIEYRGYNLRGVKTWEQLRKMYEILFSTIKEVISAEFSKEYPFLSEEEHPTEIHYNTLGIIRKQLKPDYLVSQETFLKTARVDFYVGLTNPKKRRRYSFGISKPMSKELNLIVDMKEPIKPINGYASRPERVWIPTDEEEIDNEYDEGDD